MECILMQSQDVAQHFGAVCTPEFYLFKKVKLSQCPVLFIVLLIDQHDFDLGLK